MGHLSLPAYKRNSFSLSLSFSPRGSGAAPFTHSPSPSPYRLLDLVISALFVLVLVFFVLVFTPLGDSLAASGRRSLLLAARDRDGIALAAESGRLGRIEDCAGEDVDFMPCEDPRRSSGFSREMNFYRERHCPLPGEGEVCLVPAPQGYRVPVRWPESLDKIWHENMPHNKIADRKGHQGWMKEEGPYFIFPGGGTMFPDGAGHYIEKLKQYIPNTGGTLRTALDMGCEVGKIMRL